MSGTVAAFVSDIFWRVPGVSVRYGFTSTQIVSRRSRTFGNGGGCPLKVFLDDVDMFGADMDNIDQESLDAVEVFRGMSTPVRYRFDAPCGVVLLWTRR